jgi:hypothetical protein
LPWPQQRLEREALHATAPIGLIRIGFDLCLTGNDAARGVGCSSLIPGAYKGRLGRCGSVGLAMIRPVKI